MTERWRPVGPREAREPECVENRPPAHGRAVSGAPRAARQRRPPGFHGIFTCLDRYSSSFGTCGQRSARDVTVGADAAQAHEGRGDGVAVQIADRRRLERRGRVDGRPTGRTACSCRDRGSTGPAPATPVARTPGSAAGHFWPGLLQQVGAAVGQRLGHRAGKHARLGDSAGRSSGCTGRPSSRSTEPAHILFRCSAASAVLARLTYG